MWGERRVVHRVLVGKPEGKSHLEDPGLDGSIILKWIFNTRSEGMDWIDLAQNRDRWRAIVNEVMNFLFP